MTEEMSKSDNESGIEDLERYDVSTPFRRRVLESTRLKKTKLSSSVPFKMSQRRTVRQPVRYEPDRLIDYLRDLSFVLSQRPEHTGGQEEKYTEMNFDHAQMLVEESPEKDSKTIDYLTEGISLSQSVFAKLNSPQRRSRYTDIEDFTIKDTLTPGNKSTIIYSNSKIDTDSHDYIGESILEVTSPLVEGDSSSIEKNVKYERPSPMNEVARWSPTPLPISRSEKPYTYHRFRYDPEPEFSIISDEEDDDQHIIENSCIPKIVIPDIHRTIVEKLARPIIMSKTPVPVGASKKQMSLDLMDRLYDDLIGMAEGEVLTKTSLINFLLGQGILSEEGNVDADLYQASLNYLTCEELCELEWYLF